MCYPNASTLTVLTPYITMIGGAFFGASCAYFYGVKLSQRSYSNAIELLKRQEANKAFLALESTFIPAIRILRKEHRTREDFDRFPTLFESQEIAMLSFIWHLSGEGRRIFEANWNKYEEWQKEYEELKNKTGSGILLIATERDEKIQMILDILESAKKY